jgi:hypothetical protein
MPEQLVKHIDIEVRPSRGYQTVGYTARVVFDEAISAVQAIAEAEETGALLIESAQSAIDNLIAMNAPSTKAAPVGAVTSTPAPTAPPVAGELIWLEGQKPNNAGSIRYVSSKSVTSQQMREAAVAQLGALGLSSEMVDVFDDRVGNYGLESGNASYSAGKLKVKDGTPLAAALQGKKIAGSVDFRNDGSIVVSLSKDAKAAMQALEVAESLRTLDATPV